MPPKKRKTLQTPYAKNAKPVCDGVVICVGTADVDPAQAEQIAKRIKSQKLTGQWAMQRLGKNSRDFLLHRSGRKVPIRQAWQLAHRLRGHRDVEDCQPSVYLPVEGHRVVREAATFAVSSSSSSSSGSGRHLPCSADREWALTMCRVHQAWQQTPTTGGETQGRGIVVGHPDTGYTQHPQIFDPLRLLVASGYDYEDDDRDPRDTLAGNSAGHGTSTSSVIMSGIDAPGTVITGVAPQAKLVPLRVTTSVVLLGYTKLTRAIYHAAEEGYHAVSISLGGAWGNGALLRAVQYATSQGVIMLCAAGNYWPRVVYPARYDEVIAVAACNCQRAVWSGSSSGPAVDVTAPGESVWRASIDRGGNYRSGRGSGTSYAVAMTAGAAALWLAHHDRRKLINRYGARHLATVFKEVLMTQGVDRASGWDPTNFGAGILNADKLLSANLPPTPAAGGMASLHAAPVSLRTNQVDEVLESFGEVDPSRVRNGLSRLLRVEEKLLNRTLRDVGDEITYYLAADPKFYEHFVRACFEKTGDKRKKRLASACRRLAKSASKGLKARIGS